MTVATTLFHQMVKILSGQEMQTVQGLGLLGDQTQRYLKPLWL